METKYGFDFSTKDDLPVLVVRQDKKIVAVISGENVRHILNFVNHGTTSSTSNIKLIEALLSKLAIYKKALRFYADSWIGERDGITGDFINAKPTEELVHDYGQTAREALGDE